MKNKILIIGLDGATWDLLDPLIKQGLLPTIASLKAKGSYGILKSVFPPITAPAWVSFATGVNPGKHGCYDFLKPQDSLTNLKPITTEDIKVKTFYELLEEHGKKSILINLPVSWPPRSNNITISSLLTQGDQFVSLFCLKEEIPEFKNYRITPDAKIAIRGGIEDYAKDIRQLEQTRFKVAKSLFTKKEWDLFFILFSGSDWIQHRIFPDLRDENLDTHSEAIKLYQDLDEYIGWFIKRTGKETNVFIISDHGFRSPKQAFFINAWLKKKGYLKTKKGGTKTPITRFDKEREQERNKSIKIPVECLLGFFYNQRLLFRITSFIYHKVKEILPIKIERSSETMVPLKTLAYNTTSESMGIYINDKERFTDGVVSKENYAELKKKLIKKLKNEFKVIEDEEDPKIIDFIKEKEEIYSGPYIKEAPDILLQLKKYQIVSGFSLAVFGSFRQGGHALEGIFLATGPDIKNRAEIKEINIIDIAPTLLHLMDSKIPKDIDGKVLKKIFKPDSKFSQKNPEYSEIESRDLKKGDRKFSEEEEVKQRLKSLGYL